MIVRTSTYCRLRLSNPLLSRKRPLDASRRPGVVLVAVLIVVVLLSLAAYHYSELMMAEYQAMDSYTRTAQAKGLADSGVHFTAAILSDPNSYTNTLNSNPWDNASNFQGVLVSDNSSPGRRGRFSILSLRDVDDPAVTSQPYRFGVTDEAGKLNLNSLLTLATNDTDRQNMLAMLPNMTPDVANSILDWLDSKSTIPRTNGAKDEYYPSLNPAYHVKNGPLDSLDELLLVKGLTAQLLYGNDRNRNGVLDPDEDPGDGSVDMGWQQYLTIYSREPNISSAGAPRIYLNSTDLGTLYTNLETAVGGDLAQFLVAYRLYGPAAGNTGAGGAAATKIQKLEGAAAQSVGTQIATDRTQGQQKKLTAIKGLFALTTAAVSVPVQSNGRTQNQTLPNPLADPAQQKMLLPLLFDLTTTSKSSDLTPRINVNTAPRVVLSMLTSTAIKASLLQDADVQAILDQRPPISSTVPPDPIYQTPTWLLTEANLPVKTLTALESFITTRTQVYRFQVQGYYDAPGPIARVEAVVDTNSGRPRIVYYRDLAELGRGFNLANQNRP